MQYLTLALFKIEEPADQTELLMAAGIPVVAALAIFAWGMKIVKDGGSPRPRWLALIPLGLGLLWGLRYFLFVIDPMTRVSLDLGRKIEFLHYGVALAQVGAAIAFGVWALVDKKLAERL